jgi:hypothetical protein
MMMMMMRVVAVIYNYPITIHAYVKAIQESWPLMGNWVGGNWNNRWVQDSPELSFSP